MVVCCRQNETQNYDMEVAGKRFNVEGEFKYLGRQKHETIGVHSTYVLSVFPLQARLWPRGCVEV